jgi:hypothetical protein
MQVFRVLDTVEAHGAEKDASAGASFLVGRDEEIGLFLRRWEQSKEGSGQVVQLSGEAGIGRRCCARVYAMKAYPALRTIVRPITRTVPCIL